ncbi:hypothetical protein C968_00430 [Brucella canis CNGB 513]|nr:hypothetical protein DK60_593 [Brucella canis]ENQ57009.1 hypothetical protein C969_00455 [Brucella canis CNGB 1172]ENQ61633.1 hypothetical protein C979_02015 [Brucella canis UK10/02]ENS47827.1 hypothetical protein B976_02021 [Brucella canis 79/122]ENS53504.1 hypothetical protein C968_00430 [Brucella canis CNGB 513]ENX67029.1 hypothetical protein C967_00351 [Brucella canis CNGB 1324]ENX72171.1 hypothetical protein C982_00413 [Brucella canis F7/05A]ERU03230.1 hypothetical protein P037_00426
MGHHFRHTPATAFCYLIGMFRVSLEDVLTLGCTHDNCGARIQNIIKRQNKRDHDVCFTRKQQQGCSYDQPQWGASGIAEKNAGRRAVEQGKTEKPAGSHRPDAATCQPRQPQGAE